MKLPDRLRIVAVAVTLLGCPIAGMPAQAADLVEMHRAGPPAEACLDCARTPAGPIMGAGRGATLPVNLAIVLLGGLWLALMARRIQQRGASARDGGLDDALTGVGPQPFANGR